MILRDFYFIYMRHTHMWRPQKRYGIAYQTIQPTYWKTGFELEFLQNTLKITMGDETYIKNI